MVAVFWWKACSLAILLAVSFVFNLLPAALAGWKSAKQPAFLSIANTFAGGVFLGGALIHLMTDAIEELNDNVDFNVRGVPGMLMCAGFLAVFFIEKVCQQCQTLCLIARCNDNEVAPPPPPLRPRHCMFCL
jgi:hypothetical protein